MNTYRFCDVIHILYDYTQFKQIATIINKDTVKADLYSLFTNFFFTVDGFPMIVSFVVIQLEPLLLLLK